jgi:ribonuclease D
VKHGYIILLTKCMEKSLTFGKNQSKRSQMLVQITGALRNLANDDDSYQRVCKNKLIPKLLQVLESFKGSKELMLNISRILSKVSSDPECSKAIISTKKLDFLVALMSDFQSYTPFLVRIAFVLANLTTYSEEARE